MKYNPFKENKWFILMCIMLLLLLVAAAVSGAEAIDFEVPTWGALIIVAIGAYSLYRAFGLFPQDSMTMMYGPSEEDDEEEDEDDIEV